MKRQPRPENLRWQRTLRSRETLADDLGIIGASVGPRTGPNKRSNGDQEDYVLRRLLVAWDICDRLHFPIEIRAAKDSHGQPDFVLSFLSGESIGVEVTQAGDEKYQQWLTWAEPAMQAGNIVHVPFEFDISLERAAEAVVDRIRRKNEMYDDGSYRSASVCDLVIYDNTGFHDPAAKNRLIERVRKRNDLAGRFRFVNFISNQRVWLDVFGGVQEVDVSERYEIDLPRWALTQAEKLRA